MELSELRLNGELVEHPKNIFTFAVPYKMFKEMEENVEGSFLEIGTWIKLLEFLE